MILVREEEMEAMCFCSDREIMYGGRRRRKVQWLYLFSRRTYDEEKEM